jgi:hypothetical protein
MEASDIDPNRITEPAFPPSIYITPRTASVSITSGQSVDVAFKMRAIRAGKITLSADFLPLGITATFSQAVTAEGNLTLTLTAASNVTPAAATIQVSAVSLNAEDAVTVAVNATASGQVFPSYQILALIYAPPGTNGGKSNSQVVYGSGSTTGTTDSISNSFKVGVGATASLGVQAGIVDLGANAEFTASWTRTDSASVSINKSSSNQIQDAGPGEDGIDHDYDIFYLWLNPLLNVTMDNQNNITWVIGVAGPTMYIQYVYVKWLRDPSQMPQGVAQNLADAGLTMVDYAQILKCDPFSSGNSPIDPIRFVPTIHSFPYEPPPTSHDPVPTWTYAQTSATTVSSTQESDTEYGVTISVSAGIKAFYNAQLKISDSLQWTIKSTSTQITGASQSASVTVGGPAFGYNGPTDVLVYWDTLFNSFMFAFATGTPVAVGTLADSAGNPIRHKALMLTTRGRRLRTFTDSRGEYRFYGAPQGDGTISVDDHEFPVVVGLHEPKRTLQLTA